MYIIVEMQTDANGTVSTIVTQKATRNEADSVYHQVLAAAAISAMPVHACAMMSNEGFPLEHASYRHTAVAEGE
ncbi:MAG: hypothetical protein E7425_12310 [Ruminococcaceae bacterium]|nr:hypothetical protein [Oscillospiraceae bacterium]